MNQRFLDQTYYEILEIQVDAAEHEIHRAYLVAKETYSPDSPALYTMFTPDEARELSRLIEEAYMVLSNHAARREYDSRLIGRASNANVAVQESQTLNFNTHSNPMQEKARSNPKGIEPLPAGYAKTRHGSYKVDLEFEKEVAEATEFDGQFLARLRNYKCISLDNLSDEIRVSRSYLKAIEGNDYSSLPADVFVRGFVLQYAKAMGLDGNTVANSYMKIMRNARQQ